MPQFSWLVGLGLILGLAWSVAGLPVKRAAQLVDLSLGLLLGGLAGGRAVFVAVEWEYFRLHWIEIPQVWLGGLSGSGMIWGSLLALWLAAKRVKQPVMALAERYIRLGGVLVMVTWLACWYAGTAYGPVVEGGWWGVRSRDEWGIYANRFPTQLVGACLTLLLLWVCDRLNSRRKPLAPGLVAGLGLAGLALELFGLSFLRADPAFSWLGMRLDAWGGLSLLILALLSLARYLPPFKSVESR